MGRRKAKADIPKVVPLDAGRVNKEASSPLQQNPTWFLIKEPARPRLVSPPVSQGASELSRCLQQANVRLGQEVQSLTALSASLRSAQDLANFPDWFQAWCAESPAQSSVTNPVTSSTSTTPPGTWQRDSSSNTTVTLQLGSVIPAVLPIARPASPTTPPATSSARPQAARRGNSVGR